MTNLSHIAENIQRLQAEIHATAVACGRDPQNIRLIAVTKTYPAEAVLAAADSGISDVGENRVQEAVPKIEEVSEAGERAGLRWHLIGHLQSNKARQAVQHFDMIHSVDSERLAREINRHAAAAGKLMQILIQVNVSGEDTKSGLSPDEAEAAVSRIVEECPSVRVNGFMTMAPLDAPEKARPVFKGLRELRDDLSKRISHERFTPTELSMGMSNDYLVAIEEGATLLRIGSSIFGKRG
jgi:pyridoxal phosphate enzyme (YggS family)